MKVLIVAYQTTTLLGGGLLSQVEGTVRGLKDLGVDVSRFEEWKEIDLHEFDLCHIFGANIGTYHTAAFFHRQGVKTVVSPIFFTRRSPRTVWMTVKTNHLLQRLVRGVWTDYGITSDICRWAHRVLPNTTDEANLVIQGLDVPGWAVEVVPNGVDGKYADADPTLFRETYGVENFILSVGFFGMERKNTLRFLRALQDIDRPVVMIGGVWGGSYAQECLKLANEMPRLKILDPFPPDSDLLASAYAACEIFALPSLYETPGIAALEAALAGAKVVITPHGGTRDYFGERVEYVNPYSVPSIRDGILRALSHEKNDALKRHVGQEFSWQRIAEKTLAVYERVLI
jgi:glycosyltransferase involved in cell wall biosynthesis